jgi:anhydro-N-acetylmuramic acid kinase
MNNAADRLSRVLAKSERRIFGLMSGMSMDGVDLACVDVSGNFPDLKVTRVGTHFIPYQDSLRQQLQAGRSGNVELVSRLNVLVAEAFAACVNDYLSKAGMSPQAVDAIGSHGQTLYHLIADRHSSTLQVGAPSIIAERTGILTIGNFRVRDVAVGGHGAPLVALADFILFRDPARPVFVNNLGSISNVSVVTSDLQEMTAFDTGPANMAIDHFASATAQGVDLNGSISETGRPIPELLDALLQLPFFSRPPPKSAGYAEFGPPALERIARPWSNYPVEDLVRTGVEFAARTIEQAYRSFVLPAYPQGKRIVFSGGGVHNATLMRRIAELLPDLTIEILPRDAADSKEAVAFALLANETLSGRPGNVASATGASRPVILGEIAPA